MSKKEQLKAARFSGYTGEEIGKDSLQDLSPEIKKGADRVAGAETGQLFNTATREFKDAMNIIVLKVPLY